MKKNLLLGMAATFILVLGMSPNLFAASDYPTKTISIINAYPPGGTLDIPSRTFAAFAEKQFGKPVVVITKTGGGGVVGFQAGAEAPPDGYTLTTGTSNMTLVSEGELASGRSSNFTYRDFVPIGSFILDPAIVVVNFNSRWKTLADFIKDCKAKPGSIAYSSGGNFSIGHIAVEVLTRAAGIKCRHVPYKGGGPALAAAVGDNVDFLSTFPTSSIELIRGKKIRALAIQSDRRLKALPDVPSVKELGLDAEYQTWVGVLAPKGTPQPIVEKLRAVLAKGVEDKSFHQPIEARGGEVRYLNSDQLAKYWESETQKVKKIISEIVKENPMK